MVSIVSIVHSTYSYDKNQCPEGLPHFLPCHLCSARLVIIHLIESFAEIQCQKKCKSHFSSSTSMTTGGVGRFLSNIRVGNAKSTPDLSKVFRDSVESDLDHLGADELAESPKEISSSIDSFRLSIYKRHHDEGWKSKWKEVGEIPISVKVDGSDRKLLVRWIILTSLLSVLRKANCTVAKEFDHGNKTIKMGKRWEKWLYVKERWVKVLMSSLLSKGNRPRRKKISQELQ